MQRSLFTIFKKQHRTFWVLLCFVAFLQNGVNAQANFTLADAEKAYADFNKAFYSPEKKLYWHDTKKAGVAAIWTQAIYWDLAMHVYERTKSPAQAQLIKDIYEGNYKQYDGYNWTNHKVWFIWDDMMWWIIALARAHQLTGDSVYLNKSIEGFDHVWQGSYDSANGGMWWDFKKSGKNACINFPTVIAAMRLFHITGDSAYLKKAKAAYHWANENLVDSATGRVADHKIGTGKPGFEDYTYNQGTFIGAALALYKTTGDKSYLSDATKAANYTKEKMSKGGILPAEGDFNEQGILKSIFAHYISALMNEGGQQQYKPWIKHNISTGWANRDKARGLTFRNYAVPCPAGVLQSYEASSIVTLMQLHFLQP